LEKIVAFKLEKFIKQAGVKTFEISRAGEDFVSLLHFAALNHAYNPKYKNNARLEEAIVKVSKTYPCFKNGYDLEQGNRIARTRAVVDYKRSNSLQVEAIMTGEPALMSQN
jgi:hypothetical protein